MIVEIYDPLFKEVLGVYMVDRQKLTRPDELEKQIKNIVQGATDKDELNKELLKIGFYPIEIDLYIAV